MKKEIHIYGGYVKAISPRSVNAAPLILEAESREDALAGARAAALKAFPVELGWTSHAWHIIEAVICLDGDDLLFKESENTLALNSVASRRD